MTDKHILQSKIVDALRMFGPLNCEKMIEKLKLINIEASREEVLEAFIILTMYGQIKLSDIPGHVKYRGDF